MNASAGVDTGDPDSSELSFLLLAIPVGIHETFFDGVLSDRPYIFLTTKETFGQLQDAFAFCPGSYIVY